MSGVLAHPDWKAAALSTVTRPDSVGFRNYGYLSMIIGLAGTTIAPWMQFYLQASIVEKGVTLRQHTASRLDVIIGCLFAAVVAWFIVVACAATLHSIGRVQHRDRRRCRAGAAAARRRIRLPAVRRRTVQRVAVRGVDPADLDGLRGVRGAGARIGPRQALRGGAGRSTGCYTALIVFGAGVVLVPRFPLFRVMVLSQVANGVLLPFVLIFVLLLINDAELMGKVHQLEMAQRRLVVHGRRNGRD